MFVNMATPGMKQLTVFSASADHADIEGITLIEFEEPENSIHPGLLQSYLTVLSQLAGECRIVVASIHHAEHTEAKPRLHCSVNTFFDTSSILYFINKQHSNELHIRI